MSVTLRPNEIKLKTQTGEYQSPIVLGDTTIADHVAQVNAAITAKGEETIESIPEDYTELSGEVDDLKSILEPDATAEDVGKALIAKTVNGNKVIEYEYGETTGIDDTSGEGDTDKTWSADKLSQIKPGLTDSAKAALLACFQHVAWADDHGQDCYNALYNALYADAYPKIVASFNPGLNVIYNADKLDTLKQYTIVKLFNDAQDAGTVLADSDYTLSGTLSAGSNVITVKYNNLTTYMIVAGVVDFYNIWEWSLSRGNIDCVTWSYDPNRAVSPSNTSVSYRLTRRTFVTYRGKQAHYMYDTATSQITGISPYYPIPIPAGANYYTVKGIPSGYYFYTQVTEYDEANNAYLDARVDSRITWTQQVGDEPLGHEIVGNNGNYFFGFNIKKTQAGSSEITTEPTDIEVIFSTRE